MAVPLNSGLSFGIGGEGKEDNVGSNYSTIIDSMRDWRIKTPASRIRSKGIQRGECSAC